MDSKTFIHANGSSNAIIAKCLIIKSKKFIIHLENHCWSRFCGQYRCSRLFQLCNRVNWVLKLQFFSFRLSQSPSRPVVEATLVSSKVEFLKEENHRRRLSALKKQLADAETTIRKLKTNPHGSAKRRKIDTNTCIDIRKLEVEIQSLRAANKKLEEKLHVSRILVAHVAYKMYKCRPMVSAINLLSR